MSTITFETNLKYLKLTMSIKLHGWLKLFLQLISHLLICISIYCSVLYSLQMSVHI